MIAETCEFTVYPRQAWQNLKTTQQESRKVRTERLAKRPARHQITPCSPGERYAVSAWHHAQEAAFYTEHYVSYATHAVEYVGFVVSTMVCDTCLYTFGCLLGLLGGALGAATRRGMQAQARSGFALAQWPALIVTALAVVLPCIGASLACFVATQPVAYLAGGLYGLAAQAAGYNGYMLPEEVV